MARRTSRIVGASAGAGFFDDVGKTVAALGTFGAAAAAGTFPLVTLPTACVLAGGNYADVKEFPFLGAIVLGGLLGVVLWRGQTSALLRCVSAAALGLIVFAVVLAALSRCTCESSKKAEPWFNGMTFGHGFEGLCLADRPRP